MLSTSEWRTKGYDPYVIIILATWLAHRQDDWSRVTARANRVFETYRTAYSCYVK